MLTKQSSKTATLSITASLEGQRGALKKLKNGMSTLLHPTRDQRTIFISSSFHIVHFQAMWIQLASSRLLRSKVRHLRSVNILRWFMYRPPEKQCFRINHRLYKQVAEFFFATEYTSGPASTEEFTHRANGVIHPDLPATWCIFRWRTQSTWASLLMNVDTGVYPG